jgi:hypothetical protein
MQNQKQVKLFAFQLADKRQPDAKPEQQWKVRNGVSTAACTAIPTGHDMYRDASKWNGPDGGIYC